MTNNHKQRMSLRTPAENRRSPEHIEQLFAALHQALNRQTSITIGYEHTEEDVSLFVECDEPLQQVVRNGIHAGYPNIELVETSASYRAEPGFSLYLNSDLFPLKSYREFLDDRDAPTMPLDGVLQTLATLSATAIRISLSRASKREIRRATQIARNYHIAWQLWRRHPTRWRRWLSWPLRSSVQPNESILRKLAHPNLFQVRIGIRVQDSAQVAQLQAQFAPLQQHHASNWLLLQRKRKPKPFLLTSEELATLWHPPLLAHTEHLANSEFTQLEPPQELVDDAREGVLLGETCFRERHDPVLLSQLDRLRHLHIVGKTGTGKSTLLYNMLISDLRAGHGVALIDPHGDLAEAIIAAIPKHRTREAVILDPGDTHFPIAFNLLDCPNRSLEPLVASGIVSSFKKLNADSWGPRLEDILRNAVRLLLEKEGTTLISLLRLLTNTSYRQEMTRTIRDPTVREYWQVEFPSFDKRYRTEAVAAVTNKVRPFLANLILRNILGQSPGKIHLRKIMDEGRILIVKLSKGIIGEDAVNLLGSMLVTNLQIAAMSRADIPEAERHPFFAYVDEFQNFATDSFATILSEARKYKLGLTLSHQFIEQLDETVRSAVFGNVDNLLSFRVGANDADRISQEFGELVLPTDIARLPKYTAYLRMLTDGITTRPFTIRTLPPSQLSTDRTISIRNYSRNRYARKLTIIKQQITNSFL